MTAEAGADLDLATACEALRDALLSEYADDQHAADLLLPFQKRILRATLDARSATARNASHPVPGEPGADAAFPWGTGRELLDRLIELEAAVRADERTRLP